MQIILYTQSSRVTEQMMNSCDVTYSSSCQWIQSHKAEGPHILNESNKGLRPHPRPHVAMPTQHTGSGHVEHTCEHLMEEPI